MKLKLKKKNIIILFLLIALTTALFTIYTKKEKINNLKINTSTIEKYLETENIKEEIIDENNSQYDSLEDGNIILLEYCGDEDCAIVPKELDGYKIGKIAQEAFSNKNNLEKIKIPVEISENIDIIDEFKISETLSDEEYIVYITTKEYTEAYLIYIQLDKEEKDKVETIPQKFVMKKEIEDSEPGNAPILGAVLPSHYDLRSKIKIPVENQGELGICYAYVCTTMVETNLALTKGITRDHSEIHLAVKSGEYWGGNPPNIYNKYWKLGYGPVNEVGNTLLNQSYLTRVRNSNALAGRIYNSCKNQNSPVSASDVAALDALNPGQEHYVMSMKYFQSITGEQKKKNTSAVTSNRNAIKQAIMNNGAVYTAIGSPNNSNIYVDQGTRAMMYCPSSAYGITHAVTIIGWDDSFKASYFPSSWGVTQNGAWIVLNSWGSSSGNNDGAFWISYQDYWVESDNYAIGEVSVGKVNLSKTAITLSNTSYNYDGNAKTPSVTVVYNNTSYTKGTDYTVSYKNNVNAGTATVTITGIGRFTGTVSKTFTITQKSISKATVTLNPTSYTYDGKAKTPAITVKDGSTTLTNRNTLYNIL